MAKIKLKANSLKKSIKLTKLSQTDQENIRKGTNYQY